MLHKPFRHHLKLFQTHRTWSRTSWLSLKNSSYEPRKWHFFMPYQAYIRKNGFPWSKNRFSKTIFQWLVGVFWDGNKVFRVPKTLQNPSGIISWHFETIWKNRKKFAFFIFLAWKLSILWRIWPFLSIKNFWKLFFQKQGNKSKKCSTNLLDIT